VLQARSWLPRTEGTVRLELARRDGQTRIGVLHQAGAARVRFPKPAKGAPPEAVLLNVAGGLTGGDSMHVEVTIGTGAEATLTTAAAEKIYRARDGETSTIGVKLALGAGARLAWLPQSTIVFDGSRLDRRTGVDLAGDARFLAVETLIFGRQAMGEDVHHGACRDAWRIWRDGVLVFADTFRIGGAVAAALDRPATLAGARATAVLIYVATDAASRLEAVRAMLGEAASMIAASTWNGLLVVRGYARDGRTLQGDIAPLVRMLSGRALPRVWQC
jgi:urease accessory protein